MIFDFLDKQKKEQKSAPVGRPPKGEKAMTNAERQRQYRQRKKALGTPAKCPATPAHSLVVTGFVFA